MMSGAMPPESLARALNVNVEQIHRKQTLLDGITPEVVDRLKDKAVAPATFDALRQRKPYKQLETTELLLDSGTLTATYAQAILAATRPTWSSRTSPSGCAG